MDEVLNVKCPNTAKVCKGWVENLWIFVCFHNMFSMFSQKHPEQEPRILQHQLRPALCPKAEEIVLQTKFEGPFNGHTGLQDVIVTRIDEDEPQAEWRAVVQT